MVLLNDLSSRLVLDDPEERRVFSHVSWSQYEALLADISEKSTAFRQGLQENRR
ncbi:MAG: hypothetical protein ACFBSF_22710 [Leptolyngbyaceae cyanobacterium]